MHLQRRLITPHRFARLIAWALCVVAWVAAMLAGNAAIVRHARQRDWHLGLDNLAWLVRRLILARACQLGRLRSRRRPRGHGRGPVKRNVHLLRAAAGSRLRRALRHRDMSARLSLFVHALRNIDTYAAPLARRLVKRCLTRLAPILPAPTADALILGAPASPPACADSS